MYDQRQLLCTFSNINEFESLINKIFDHYTIYNNCVFVFCNKKNKKEFFITYNVFPGKGEFPNTILIHRKKQTNTLYSLNALNTLIVEENGCLSKTFQIKWDLYKDSLIISGEVSVKIIPIKIYDIIKR